MDKKDYSQLKVLASQLEGQVCKELRPVKKYYQLMVFSGVFSAEARINRYPVPDPKTALIIIDIILSNLSSWAMMTVSFLCSIKMTWMKSGKTGRASGATVYVGIMK